MKSIVIILSVMSFMACEFKFNEKISLIKMLFKVQMHNAIVCLVVDGKMTAMIVGVLRLAFQHAH